MNLQATLLTGRLKASGTNKDSSSKSKTNHDVLKETPHFYKRRLLRDSRFGELQ